MSYAKVQNNKVTRYPYLDSQLRKDNPNTSFPSAMDDQTRADYNSYPVVDSPPSYTSGHQYPSQNPIEDWLVVDGIVEITYSVVDIDVANRKLQLVKRIEDKRWEVEVGGMSFNGMQVPTDDRSKTLTLGARTAAIEQGEDYYDEWKISPGVYIPLNAETAIALGDALLAHIRASFAREKVLSLAALAAEDHDALDLVEAEIDNDWPV